MSANYNPEYKDELDYLDEYLNKEKNDGLEDIYWELVGSGEPGEAGESGYQRVDSGEKRERPDPADRFFLPWKFREFQKAAGCL